MGYPHWEYFLALDADLERAVRFIAPEPANFSAYSLELARLLFGACSEIDVVAKALCVKLVQESKCENIDDYRTVIVKKYQKFPTIKAAIPRYGLEFQPWVNWGSGTNPAWWQSYNKVKHERTSHFPEANLKNSLDAVAGLFLLCLYYYQPALYDHNLLPWPNLFHLHSDHYHDFRMVGKYKLPDFEDSDEWAKKKGVSPLSPHIPLPTKGAGGEASQSGGV